MEGLGQCLILVRLMSQSITDSGELFPSVLEAEGSRSGWQHGWVLLGTLLRAVRAGLSLCPHMAESSQPSCDSYKDTNAFPEGSVLLTSSTPKYLPKTPPPNTIILDGRVSTYELWRDTHSVRVLQCGTLKGK